MSTSVVLYYTTPMPGQKSPCIPRDTHVFPSCPDLFAYKCQHEGCHNMANYGAMCAIHRRKAGRKRKRRVGEWDHNCFICAEPGELLCCEAHGCTRAAHAACTGLSAVPTTKWYCEDCTTPDSPFGVATAAAWLLRLSEQLPSKATGVSDVVKVASSETQVRERHGKRYERERNGKRYE